MLQYIQELTKARVRTTSSLREAERSYELELLKLPVRTINAGVDVNVAKVAHCSFSTHLMTWSSRS